MSHVRNRRCHPARLYPDERAPGGQRWWDGLGWTEYRKSPAEVAQTAAVGPQALPVAPYTMAAPAAPAVLAQIVDPVTGEVPLWAPLYGATFGQAWKRFWRKYADFSGRASRSEFWWAYLGVLLTFFAAYLVLGTIFVASFLLAGRSEFETGTGVVSMLVSLLFFAGYIGVLIPIIAAAVRRLHDAGYPGTYCLLGFIPVAGPILLLVYLASESKPAGAVYDRPTA